MRQASSNRDSTGFFNIEGGDEFQSLMLGGGGCAEHQRGIDSLKVALGIDRSRSPGIERHMVRKIRDGYVVALLEDPRNEQSALIFGSHHTVGSVLPATDKIKEIAPGCYRGTGFNKEGANRIAFIPNFFRDPATQRLTQVRKSTSKALLKVWQEENAGVYGAWDEREFMVRVLGAEHCAKLVEIFEAFVRQDVTVSITSSPNPFGRPGLALTIASRLSEDARLKVERAEKSHDLLLATVERMGFMKAFGGQGFYGKAMAVSPKWTVEAEKRLMAGGEFVPTEDSIRVWVNPMGNDYRHGWFTPEDIRQFARGTGPVRKDWAEERPSGPTA